MNAKWFHLGLVIFIRGLLGLHRLIVSFGYARFNSFLSQFLCDQDFLSGVMNLGGFYCCKLVMLASENIT